MNINLCLYAIPTPYDSFDPRAISGSFSLDAASGYPITGTERIIVDGEPFGYAIFVPREWVRVSGCYTKEDRYNSWRYDEHLVFDFIPRIANALVDNYYIMASFQGCPVNLPKVMMHYPYPSRNGNRVATRYGEWWEDYAYVACHLGRIDQLLSLMGLSPVSFSDFSMDEIEDAATRVSIDDHIVIAYRPVDYPVVWLDEKEDEVLLRLALG